jgi:hypothetical protein
VRRGERRRQCGSPRTSGAILANTTSPWGGAH